MSGAARGSQSLLAVTNRESRAFTPSEVYKPAFSEWAHAHGAHLYMVLVGPRTDIRELQPEENRWLLRAWFHNGVEMKPRTIPVPFEVLPRRNTALKDGAIEWTDASGRVHRSNAAQIARSVLQYSDRIGKGADQWRAQTINKFFTYKVEYIGQSYGKHGERTAAERIGEGHKQVQQVIAEVSDLHPRAAVGLIVMDAQVQGREMHFSLSRDNLSEVTQQIRQFMVQPDGPLIDSGKLVTAAEAMLIRSFPDARNDQYKKFPVMDAPALVRELTEAGISHMGVHLDVSQSMARIRHPDAGQAPASVMRFAVNLSTGDRETPSTTAPFAWRAD